MFKQALAEAGLTEKDYSRVTLWEMDHIEEVAEGGGASGLENLQTLCLRCHREKTARYARERAKRRRNAPPVPVVYCEDTEEPFEVPATWHGKRVIMEAIRKWGLLPPADRYYAIRTANDWVIQPKE